MAGAVRVNGGAQQLALDPTQTAQLMQRFRDEVQRLKPAAIVTAVDIPSWGKMVSESRIYLQTFWHMAVIPTLLIAITMLAFTFVGDGLRDAFDPQV